MYKLNKYKEKIWWWLAYKLPGRLLLFAIVRGFAIATMDKYGNTHVDDVNYKMVYDRIVEKYNLK